LRLRVDRRSRVDVCPSRPRSVHDEAEGGAAASAEIGHLRMASLIAQCLCSREVRLEQELEDGEFFTRQCSRKVRHWVHGNAAKRLDEPLPHTPLVLSEQHAAELGERVGRVVERSDDCFAIGHRQREHDRFAVVGGLEPLRRVVEAGVAEQPGQLENIAIANRDAGEVHPVERTPVRVSPSPTGSEGQLVRAAARRPPDRCEKPNADDCDDACTDRDGPGSGGGQPGVLRERAELAEARLFAGSRTL